jgi:hypothetical protein
MRKLGVSNLPSVQEATSKSIDFTLNFGAPVVGKAYIINPEFEKKRRKEIQEAFLSPIEIPRVAAGYIYGNKAYPSDWVDFSIDATGTLGDFIKKNVDSFSNKKLCLTKNFTGYDGKCASYYKKERDIEGFNIFNAYYISLMLSVAEVAQKHRILVEKAKNNEDITQALNDVLAVKARKAVFNINTKTIDFTDEIEFITNLTDGYEQTVREALKEVKEANDVINEP